MTNQNLSEILVCVILGWRSAEIFSSVKKHFTGRQCLVLFLDPPFFSVFLIISHQHMECGYADVHGIMYLKVNGEMTSSTKQSLLVHISLALTLRPLRVPGSFDVVCWACTLYFFWKGPDVSHSPALLRLCSCMETCVNKASCFSFTLSVWPHIKCFILHCRPFENLLAMQLNIIVVALSFFFFIQSQCLFLFLCVFLFIAVWDRFRCNSDCFRC